MYLSKNYFKVQNIYVLFEMIGGDIIVSNINYPVQFVPIKKNNLKQIINTKINTHFSI